jgi:diketogulonate reductase-like aldo/keto reductase
MESSCGAAAWLLQQSVISIPRTSNFERLNENISIFDFELSREEMAEISGWARPDGRWSTFLGLLSGTDMFVQTF